MAVVDVEAMVGEKVKALLRDVETTKQKFLAGGMEEGDAIAFANVSVLCARIAVLEVYVDNLLEAARQ